MENTSFYACYNLQRLNCNKNSDNHRVRAADGLKELCRRKNVKIICFSLISSYKDFSYFYSAFVQLKHIQIITATWI